MRKPVRGGRGGPTRGGAKTGSPMSGGPSRGGAKTGSPMSGGGKRGGAKTGSPMSGPGPAKPKARFADGDAPRRNKGQRMAAKMAKGNESYGARGRGSTAPTPPSAPATRRGMPSATPGGGGLGPIKSPGPGEPRRRPPGTRRKPPYSVT